MQMMTVVDQDGVWVMNPHGFRFVDPYTQTAFEPSGHAVKIKVGKGSWIEQQIDAGVLALTDDPSAVRTPTDAEVAEAREQKAKSEAALRAGGAGNPSGTSGEPALEPPKKAKG